MRRFFGDTLRKSFITPTATLTMFKEQRANVDVEIAMPKLALKAAHHPKPNPPPPRPPRPPPPPPGPSVQTEIRAALRSMSAIPPKADMVQHGICPLTNHVLLR